MHKLLLAFLISLGIIGLSYADYRFNPYTGKLDYYDGNASISNATGWTRSGTNVSLTNINDSVIINSTNNTAFQVNNATGTSIFTVDTTSGNVTIGTATTEAKLHVSSPDSVVSGETPVAAFSDVTKAYGVKLGWRANGTDALGGSIRSVSSKPLMLGTSAAPTALWIADSGRIGIGTTAPATLLEVSASSAATLRATFTGTPVAGTSSEFQMMLSNKPTAADLQLGQLGFGAPDSGGTARIGAAIVSNSGADWGTLNNRAAYLTFATTPPTSTNRAERMRINEYGLSIGTTTPIANGLTVNNAIFAGNNIVLNNNALSFDGSNDNVLIGDITELNAVSTFSISMWLNHTSTNQTAYLFQKGVTAGTRVIITETAGDVRLYVGDGAGDDYGYFDGDAVFTAGRWHHLALVYDGAGATNADKLKIYADGVLQTLTFSGTIPATTLDLAGLTARIGYTSVAFNGKIKRFRIYSSAISQANVTTLYQGTDFTTGLVHYYKLDEGTGTVATDTGSNPMNGTISGATWTTSDYTGLGTTFPTTRLSFPAATDISSGISWGNDAWLYRSGVNALMVNATVNVTGLILPTRTTLIASPVAGSTFFNTTDDKLYIYNGTAWRSAAF